MTNPRENTNLPPVAVAYLNDLDFALRHSDDRDEIVRSVTEHLEATASEAPEAQRAESVRDALRQLGTVEQLASTAVERPAPREAPPVDHAIGSWILAGAGIASIPAALLIPYAGVAVAVAIAAASGATLWLDRGRRSARRRPLTVALSGALVAVVGTALLWTLLMPVEYEGPSDEITVTGVPIG
jgi:hypothetical protein